MFFTILSLKNDDLFIMRRFHNKLMNVLLIRYEEAGFIASSKIIVSMLLIVIDVPLRVIRLTLRPIFILNLSSLSAACRLF